jgi:hypothetical protein
LLEPETARELRWEVRRQLLRARSITDRPASGRALCVLRPKRRARSPCTMLRPRARAQALMPERLPGAHSLYAGEREWVEVVSGPPPPTLPPVLNGHVSSQPPY